MVAVVSVETVLLVLLVVLVAALLRSHAEILRRLGPEDAGKGEPSSTRSAAPGREPSLAPPPARGREPSLAPPPARDRSDIGAPEIAGATPTGDAIKLAFGGTPTLLAFLSTGCTSCATFWHTLGENRLPAGLGTVIVTRGVDREQRSKVRSLAPAAVPVVMSSEAWEDYAVPGSPYFVLIDDSEVRGEGVATNWTALTSLLGDAIEDQREGQTLDARLAAAGIGPEHPSLYPGEPA